MEFDPRPGPRLAWDEVVRRRECRGRWVALHRCSYDEITGHAAEGELVDLDEDLVELCNRVRASKRRDCAIVYCAN